MKLQNYFHWFVVVTVSGYLLVVGKKLLIPLVLATIIWYLIDILTGLFEKISFRERHIPRSVCFGFSLVTIFLLANGVISLIIGNIADVIRVAPEYQENFQKISERVLSTLRIEKTPSLKQVFSSFDVGAALSQFAGALTSIIGNTGIIIIYLIFLFIEHKSFNSKLSALIQDPDQKDKALRIIQRIGSEIRVYVGIKTLTSTLTGFFSYLIMAMVGLDFAEFWAMLIFLLNFIPTIGSIMATIFPVLLAIIQFGTVYHFVIVACPIGGLQFLIGNILEPRLMGNTLNLSPLVILLSLALWGALWGITGMILCVPITVICMIICSHFPQTRGVAIILSKDGNVKED